MAINIKDLLGRMMDVNASDLHITAHSPMQFRIDEKLVPVDNKVLSPEEAKTAVYSLLTKDQIEKFEKDWELDFSFGIEKIARFRVNVFKQRLFIGCAIRLIPYEIMT
ncbi:MAG: type IV pili twitching motility protein PilT, partial [Candidatus Omnitrophica bacterium]|nr:type IV pili twitching motility protein PilT [Candidatus Omnitrophota bacterium]